MRNKKPVTAIDDGIFLLKTMVLTVFVYFIYESGYDSDAGRMLKHWAFIFVHLYVFGVKRFTVGNFNGFDILFGFFYLYFWWQNPWGFMFSYFAVGYICYALLRLRPIRDDSENETV